MIRGNAEPIAHVPPRKRVDLNPLFVEKPDIAAIAVRAVWRAYNDPRINKVWDAVVDTATGTNVSSSPVIREEPEKVFLAIWSST